MWKEYKMMWLALRAAIQMGGASLTEWRQNKITPRRWHACLVSEGTQQNLSLIEGIEAPRSGMRDARRRLMSRGQYYGYHWKDGR